MNRRVVFLLGAGVSQAVSPKSLPASTRDITYAALAQRPCVGDPPYPGVVRFLCVLRREAARYYSIAGEPRKLINYEDLYYLAEQIRDAKVGEFDNPAIQALVDFLIDCSAVQRALADAEESANEEGVLTLAHFAVESIRDRVVGALGSLQPQPSEVLTRLRTFEIFLDAATATGQQVDVFTLNHDVLLETYLQQRAASMSGGKPLFHDGFSGVPGGACIWNPQTYDGSDAPLRLFKLHGSINWWLRTNVTEGPWPPFFRLENHADLAQPRYPGESLSAAGPMLLIGRFNKMLQQTSGVYLEILCRLRASLKSCGRLVVAGCSLGDKGVNSLMIEWLAEPANAAVVICLRRSNLLGGVRGAMQGMLPYFEATGQVTILDEGLEGHSWSDVESSLDR